MPKNKIVDLHSARNPKYRATLEQIAQDGKCPFCPGNFLYKTSVILKRTGGWVAVRNMHPYANARVHLLIVSTKHLEQFTELSVNDFVSIRKLVKWATVRFRIRGGAFMMRFGNTRYTGATVCHLHGHLVVPKYTFKTGRAKVVQFPVG